jgi:hydrogenase maturation factor
VTFAQPELRVPDEPHCDPNSGCITCGDVAEEMRVVAIDAERELALCQHESGERQTVEIALVQPVEETDVLLVHAGTAISNLGQTPRTPGRGSSMESPRRSRGQDVPAGAEDVAGVVL